jgi:hypothetical protein
MCFLIIIKEMTIVYTNLRKDSGGQHSFLDAFPFSSLSVSAK